MRLMFRQFLVIAVVSLWGLGPAWAEPRTTTAAVRYEFTFAGIPFGWTRYEGTFGPAGYTARASFQTSGLVSVFWQAAIEASAAGRLNAHALDPDWYDSLYRRGSGRQQRVKIEFGQGEPKTLAEPAYDTTTYPVTAAQKREADDPMSALALIATGLTATSKDLCGTVAPVFDGKRRYDLAFTYVKDVPVKFRGGLFTGTAHLCQVQYRQIAGYKQKILKEGQQWPSIYCWMAEIPHPSSPTGRYLVVLKLWANTKWGRLEARLTERTFTSP